MWQVKELSRQCLDLLTKMHVRASIDYAITVFGPCLNLMQTRPHTTVRNSDIQVCVAGEYDF